MKCVLAAWHRHEAELAGYLRHRLGDTSEADDLLQEVFVKAMRQGAAFCALDNPRAWLFQVARNALVDMQRLGKPVLPLPEELAAPVAEGPAPVDALAQCLPRVLSELSDEDRDALTRCDIEGMTQAVYAQVLGLSVPAAKSRVQRARAAARAPGGSLPGALRRRRQGVLLRAPAPAALNRILFAPRSSP